MKLEVQRVVLIKKYVKFQHHKFLKCAFIMSKHDYHNDSREREHEKKDKILVDLIFIDHYDPWLSSKSLQLLKSNPCTEHFKFLSDPWLFKSVGNQWTSIKKLPFTKHYPMSSSKILLNFKFCLIGNFIANEVNKRCSYPHFLVLLCILLMWLSILTWYQSWGWYFSPWLHEGIVEE